MRSNSGKDESRNNMHDPTVRDRSMERDKAKTTTGKLRAPADHRKSRKH